MTDVVLYFIGVLVYLPDGSQVRYIWYQQTKFIIDWYETNILMDPHEYNNQFFKPGEHVRETERPREVVFRGTATINHTDVHIRRRWGQIGGRGPSRVPEVEGMGTIGLWWECGRGKRKDRWFEDKTGSGSSSDKEVQRDYNINSLGLGLLRDKIYQLCLMNQNTLSWAMFQTRMTIGLIRWCVGLLGSNWTRG